MRLPLWRNWLARSAVNRKVGGSSPPRGVDTFCKNNSNTLMSYNQSITYSICGSVAEWSKALVLGTSLFGGVGSNPTTANTFVLCFGNQYLKL